MKISPQVQDDFLFECSRLGIPIYLDTLIYDAIFMALIFLLKRVKEV